MEPIENAVIVAAEKVALEVAPDVVSHILADAVDAAEALADEVVELVKDFPSAVSHVLQVIECCVLPAPQS